MVDYSTMTDGDFYKYLIRLLEDLRGTDLLQVPGVYDIVSEHYNNDVLYLWAEDNPKLAYPEDVEEDEEA